MSIDTTYTTTATPRALAADMADAADLDFIPLTDEAVAVAQELLRQLVAGEIAPERATKELAAVVVNDRESSMRAAVMSLPQTECNGVAAPYLLREVLRTRIAAMQGILAALDKAIHEADPMGDIDE